jgi:hypothetical protein
MGEVLSYVIRHFGTSATARLSCRNDRACSGGAAARQRLCCYQALGMMILEHLVDHPVAGTTVAARSAGSRDGLAGIGARSDRTLDVGFRDGKADADVHAAFSVLKIIFSSREPASISAGFVIHE